MDDLTRTVYSWINNLDEGEQWVYRSTARDAIRENGLNGPDDYTDEIFGLVYDTAYRRPASMLLSDARELREKIPSESDLDSVDWELLTRVLASQESVS